MVGANHLLHMQWQQPNNHPICHSCGAIVLLLLQHRLTFCNSSRLIILRASLAFREHLWPSLQVLAKPFNHQSHPSTLLLTPKDHFNQMVCHISSEECLTLVSRTTSPFKHINHAWPGMIYQALHQGLQHPLKRIFPSATVIEYFNVITSSPLFQESTHSGVASALYSSLGTTPYFSVSFPLLVSKVQVALHL
jgi:hypothetical protein